MAINLGRAHRKPIDPETIAIGTIEPVKHTPINVGPGTYNPEKNPKEARENVAPFNAMKNRALADTTENPGPGSYAAEKTKIVATVKDMMSNSFSTKIPRFCPTAPGSSNFKPPTYLTNPGPGTHFKSLRFTGLPSDLDQSREKYLSKKHKTQVNKLQPRAASIPSKKVNSNMYTHRGFDKVGPALYNPNLDTTKNRAPVGDFITSRDKRRVFEPTIDIENKQYPPRENPGPGTYSDTEKSKQPKAFNSAGNTSIFISKVPNCKDTKIKNDKPGPGHYTNVHPAMTAGDGSTMGSTMGDSKFDQSTNGRQNLNPFMSTTMRGDFWKNELNAPFTAQTYLENPGPNHYKVEKKKGEDIKSRLLQEETVQVAFQQQEERDCNKLVKAPNPGPGAYIDINNPNNSSICKGLSKIREDRTLAESQGVKIGVFGSNTQRKKDSWLNVRNENPGPGSYNTQSLQGKPDLDLLITGKPAGTSTMSTSGYLPAGDTTLSKERAMSNAIFSSKTDRFNLSYHGKDHGIRILKTQGANRAKIIAQSEAGKHVYDKDALFGVENQISCINEPDVWKQHKQRASDYEAVNGKRVGFDATSNRFNYNQVFYGTSLKLEVPGPGLYKDGQDKPKRPRTMNQPRNKQLKYGSFNSSEKRFRPRGTASIYQPTGTQTIIGPGSYVNNDNSFIKKSYNMSMEHSYFV